MDHSLAWAIGGLALVIAELVTGTFYLLMLGVAAFGAAAAAYLGLQFSSQVIAAALIAALGCYGVRAYRAKTARSRCRPSTRASRRLSSNGSIRQRGSRACNIAARLGKRWSKGRRCPGPAASSTF
jgi:membrane protein implicated in regulation of membrane protease activity